MANTVKDTVATRKVAIVAADGVHSDSLRAMMDALIAAGAAGKIVAPRLGVLKGEDGGEFMIDFSLLTASSVLFDAVYLPGGKRSVAALSDERDAVDFLTDAYRHCKTIAATGEAVGFLRSLPGILDARSTNGRKDKEGELTDPGIVLAATGLTPQTAQTFIKALAQHRHWNRRRKNHLGPTPGDDETRGRGVLASK